MATYPLSAGRIGAQPGDPAEARRAREFRNAVRHSALVKALRVLMPTLAVAAASLYVIPAKWSFKVDDAEVAIDAVDVSSGDLRMTNPRIKGQNKTQGKYDVRAASATQTAGEPDTIMLFEIEADLTNDKGEITTLRSPTGVYKSKLEELTFTRTVDVTRSGGLAARLKTATASFPKNLVVSKEPVEVLLRESVIRANGLELMTDKSQATFSGDVYVRLVREGPGAPAAAPVALPAGSGANPGAALDPTKPVDITAQTLDVDDAKKLAVFRGAVTAVQEEFRLTSNELRVAYSATAGGAAATPAAGDVKYIEALGSVFVTAKNNQTARGERAVYDAATQMMTMTDAVTVAQDKNSIQSDSVAFDGAAGKSTFLMAGERRLRAVFTPKGADSEAAAPKPAPKPAQPAQPAAATAPGALLSQADAKKPIVVDARALEVDDKKQLAIFRENVSATQGDFNIRAKELRVTYASAASGAATGAAAQGAGDVRYIEAKGKVLVKSKEQDASSDSAVFDVKAQTVTLIDNVVVTQGKNIIKGDRLVIDVPTGRSTFLMNDNRKMRAFLAPRSEGEGDDKDEKTAKPKAKAAPAAGE
ncbi:MAG: LptA/OstA family protein [Hyphomicrobiales bacterium]|nr:LptA/OstA family protein [Hyphomicrobiales bacterium]